MTTIIDQRNKRTLEVNPADPIDKHILSIAKQMERQSERADQTASDIYWGAIRDGKSHVEAAQILDDIVRGEQ